MLSFKTIVTSGLLIIGGMLVINNEMSIGQFIAAEIIILLIINSVEKLIVSLDTFYDVLTYLEKLGQLVDKPLEPQHGESPDLAKGVYISLENISYSVEEKAEPLLKEISLTICKGDLLHITGGNGSGKSSLLKLIAGMYQPSEGNIYLNDLNYHSININHLRSAIAVVLSEETPFEGSIKDNITMGNPDITDEQIFDIINNIGLTSFVKDQKLGLQTILYPEGQYIPSSVSKKIVFARAIAQAPKVLILEHLIELYRAEEAKSIAEYLLKLNKDMILIIVDKSCHWEDITTKQIVLEKGKIITTKS